MAKDLNPARYLEDLKSRRPAHEPEAGFVEVIDEPQHFHRFENDYVRVYDVRFKPGESSLYHRHTKDTMYVTIADTNIHDQTFGQERGQDFDLHAGLTGCRPHGTEPLIHRVRNGGTSLMHMIGAEHKKTAPVVAEKPLQAPHHSPVDAPFKGETIRFYRVVLEPGESTGPVRYDFSGLLVSISDASIEIEGADGSRQVLSFAPGSRLWHDGRSPAA